LKIKSLRSRLTFLHSAFIAGMLFVFGTAIYVLVNVILLIQVDTTLESTARDIMQAARVTDRNEVTLGDYSMGSGSITYAQIWGLGRLYDQSSNLNINSPLDPSGLTTGTVIYHDAYINGGHYRVLTVPLRNGERAGGTLQVARELGTVDMARANLISTILAVSVLVVVLSIVGSWATLGRALSPLASIRETVDQINRADDLSRRIPDQGGLDAELENIVIAFNQTLERLESIFNSQQRFITDVSHELRTPLTVIKGSVDLMRRFKKADEDSLNSIDQEAGRLTRLVGGLLMLAQAEAGKLPLVFKPVELDLLLTEVFTEMRVLAGSKVQVHLNDIDQVIVNGDRDRLKQVLLNLVANAIQYTPPGGEIFLSLSRIGDQGRLIVRDTGPGIPGEDLPHIFDRFYRAEKSRTRSKVSGFGLGLSIAHWIIEQHGGEIKVESKQGEGTTFVIWLNVVK
jgi:two-component system, OmpR family, sensor kinase